MESKTSREDAEIAFESVLKSNETNRFALYGKSLILYSRGKIEESAKFLRNALDQDLQENEGHADVLRDKLVELLEPKPPTKVIILDELKKKFDNVHQESFLLNFMTIPESFPKPWRVQNPFVKPQPLPAEATTSSFNTPVKINNEYFCVICGKGFTKIFSLNRHMFVHSGIKNHSCSTCGRSFVQKSDMIRHETTHSESFNVPCTFADCVKSFKTTKSMRSHLIIHSTERPFKCQHCAKTFKVRRLLKFHEGLHLEIKPFNCDLCGKGFPAKPYLKSHMVSHTGSSSFSCSLCPASYKRNYDLSYHIKIRHLSKHVNEEEQF